jgi:hypothetical protein
MTRLLEIPNTSKGERRHDHDPTIGNVSRLEVHLRLKREALALAYLRAAHAYMLISMPTGTSTIFGVFQAILALSFFNFFSRTDSILGHKLVRNEKFASEIFFKLVLILFDYAAPRKEFTSLCGGL